MSALQSAIQPAACTVQAEERPRSGSMTGDATACRVFALRVGTDLVEPAPLALLAPGVELCACPFPVVFDSDETWRVEQIAKACVRTIREVQPYGPYHLAGWGEAGLVAYETAYQLVGADEEVAFLALVDTAPPLGKEHRGGSAGSSPADGQPEAGSRLAWQYGLPPLPVTVNVVVGDDWRGRALLHAWRKRGGAGTKVVSASCDSAALARGQGAPALGQMLREHTGSAPAVRERDHASCMTIQVGAAKAAPLFCIPGAGASVTSFVQLAQAIGPDTPIHGLQPRGLCGAMVPHADVVCAARTYVQAVLDAAPYGPIHLLGHSYGGWVALEMAHQLSTLGREPASVHVLDSRAPTLPDAQHTHYSSAQALEKLVKLYELQANQPIELRAADFESLTADAQVALLLRKLIDVKVLPARATTKMIDGVVRVFRSNLNTCYTPTRVYSHPVHLILATDNDGECVDSVLTEWKYHAPFVQHWQSSGNHLTLLSPPHIDTLAARIAQQLRDSEARWKEARG